MDVLRHRLSLAVVSGALVVGLAGPASAYDFPRKLRPGDTGKDVRALQVRIAGWFPGNDRIQFVIDGEFGPQTLAALNNLQKKVGLTIQDVATREVFDFLNSLEDPDGSTAHFDFSEFKQNRNSACSAQANAYAGTFKGGPIPARRIKRNVRRLMWRLEAVRYKTGSNPVGINSGYRSLAYNQCIGGATASQHLYGTAADNRIANITNRRGRRVARFSQVSGIGCYATQTHNHFDIRIENRDLPSSQFWWWPRRDRYGRELDESGRPCWGEVVRTARMSARTTAMVLREVQQGVPGAGSLVPSPEEIAAFEAAGEVDDLGGAD